MATLTIRDLDDSLKLSLRMRAASRNHSMEEEARQILKSALESPPSGLDLASRIRARVADLGGVDLEIPPREPTREPPLFEDFPASAVEGPSARTSKTR